MSNLFEESNRRRRREYEEPPAPSGAAAAAAAPPPPGVPPGMTPEMMSFMTTMIREGVTAGVQAATAATAAAAGSSSPTTFSNGGGEDSIMKTIMSKLMKSPGTYDGSGGPIAWADWWFEFANWLCAIEGPELGGELEHARRHATPITPSMLTDVQLARSRRLFASLSSLMKGKLATTVRSQAEERNGFELLRLLESELSPANLAAILEAIRHMLEFPWSRRTDKFVQEVHEFELLIARSETLAKVRWPDVLKLAVMMKGIPKDIVTQLMMTTTIDSTYNNVRDDVLKYSRAVVKAPTPTTKTTTTPTDMEIDAVSRDNIVCFHCQESGHYARNCPNEGGKGKKGANDEKEKGKGKGKAKGKGKGKGKVYKKYAVKKWISFIDEEGQEFWEEEKEENQDVNQVDLHEEQQEGDDEYDWDGDPIAQIQGLVGAIEVMPISSTFEVDQNSSTCEVDQNPAYDIDNFLDGDDGLNLSSELNSEVERMFQRAVELSCDDDDDDFTYECDDERGHPRAVIVKSYDEPSPSLKSSSVAVKPSRDFNRQYYCKNECLGDARKDSAYRKFFRDDVNINGLVAVIKSDDEQKRFLAATRNWCNILVDSGAVVHVAPESFCREAALRPGLPGLTLVAANGSSIGYVGRRAVVLNSSSSHGGRVPLNVVFEICKVNRPILSADKLVDKGFEVHFGQYPYISYNDTYLPLVRVRGLYFLRVPSFAKAMSPAAIHAVDWNFEKTRALFIGSNETVPAATDMDVTTNDVTPTVDTWIKTETEWQRVHNVPRRDLFHPEEADEGPEVEELMDERTTVLTDENGRKRLVKDSWPEGMAHWQPETTLGLWTGVTKFRLKVRRGDDDNDNQKKAVRFNDDVAGTTSQGASSSSSSSSSSSNVVNSSSSAATTEHGVSTNSASLFHHEQASLLAEEPSPLTAKDDLTGHDYDVHRLTHLPYSNRCPLCRAGKAVDGPHHQRVSPEAVDTRPEMQFDYSFGEDNEVKLLSIWSLSQHFGDTTVIDAKGPTNAAVDFLVSFFRRTGLTEFTLRCDSEPSVMALAKRAGAVSGMKVTYEYTPRKSPQSLGAVGRYQQSVQGQVRTMLEELQARYEIEVATMQKHDALTWLVRHASWLLARFHRPLGQVTAFQYITGRVYGGKVLNFGECVSGLETLSTRVSKLRTRWLSGVWLGRASNTDEHLVLLDGGCEVRRFRQIKPAPSEFARWNSRHLLASCCVTPWRMKVVTPALPSAVTDEKTLSAPPGLDRVVVSRHGFVKTPGCSGCFPPGGRSGFRHNVECQQRRGKSTDDMPTSPTTDAAAALSTPTTTTSTTDTSATPTTETTTGGDADDTAMNVSPGADVNDHGDAAVTQRKRGRGDGDDGGDAARLGEDDDKDQEDVRRFRIGVKRSQEDVDKRNEEMSKRMRSIVSVISHVLDMPEDVDEDQAQSTIKSFHEFVDDCTDDELVTAIHSIMTIDDDELDPVKVLAGKRKELDQCDDMGVFEPVLRSTLLPTDKVVGSRWVLKNKGSEVRARLVGQQFSDGVKLAELYASTPALASFRVFMSHIAIMMKSDKIKNFTVSAIDVITAFLNAFLKPNERLFIRPPPEYLERHGLSNDYVLKLNRSLYGTRSAAKNWQDCFTGILHEAGLHELKSEPNIFKNESGSVCLVVHVDDALIAGDGDDVQKLITFISTKVKIRDQIQSLKKDGDELEFLGRTVRRTAKGFQVVSDAGLKTLSKLKTLLGMENSSSVSTPAVAATKNDDVTGLSDDDASLYKSGTGMALWLAHDRVDCQFAVRSLAQRMSNPRVCDLAALKRLVRYLVLVPQLTYVYEPSGNTKAIQGWSDSDWGGDIVGRRSCSGGLVCFQGMLLCSWSRTQHVISLSSAEAELYALSLLACEALAVQNVLCELGHEGTFVCLHTDSSAAKANVEKSSSRGMRHIEIKELFIRDLLKMQRIRIRKTSGLCNVADVLTKGVDKATLSRLLNLLPVIAG